MATLYFVMKLYVVFAFSFDGALVASRIVVKQTCSLYFTKTSNFAGVMYYVGISLYPWLIASHFVVKIRYAVNFTLSSLFWP